ncbi:MAG: hypothetical protein LBT70_01420 [Holosporaceae bacterium]|jgi:hypothetical protein|nr:hypothetical protein [Holosporaceae bacterium]
MNGKSLILGLCVAVLSCSVIEVKCVENQEQGRTWYNAESAAEAIEQDRTPTKEELFEIVRRAVGDARFIPIITEALAKRNYDFTQEDLIGAIEDLAIWGQEGAAAGGNTIILANIFWPRIEALQIPRNAFSRALSFAKANNKNQTNEMVGYLQWQRSVPQLPQPPQAGGN